jgi:hypothetical protein
MRWLRSAGYNRRSLVETAMFRYKTVIGRRLLWTVPEAPAIDRTYNNNINHPRPLA